MANVIKSVRLPPGCGKLLEEPLYYNEYQQRFMRARRMRFCLKCAKYGYMTENGEFTCSTCGTAHNGRWGNLTAPRAFNRFLLLAGRGGGKTLVGAHGVREELMIPGSVWWAMGASYKLLHDSTFPTLVGLIHPKWVKRWDAEHMELTLTNDSMVAFRSLEDPDRARGPHGVGGMWMDEAAQCPERAWHVGLPMLMKAGGVAIATTTVLGYDWTYDQIEKPALVYKHRGYWTAKWKTIENPLFRSNPVMMKEIERAQQTMPPEMFAQEYEGERSNAQGLVYNFKTEIEANVLRNDDEIKAFIPEWPSISPSRQILIGIDEGADHPFGCVMAVVTEKGVVVVGEWLERMKATSAAHDVVYSHFGLSRFPNKTFAGNKNALNLRLEWGLKGTGVVQAESKHEVGIQRVHSWLLTKQLKFAYTCPKTIEQMRAYRYRENVKPSTGEKTAKEEVFKLADELPDGIRYMMMAWPHLPEVTEVVLPPAEQARLNAFDQKTRNEIALLKKLADDKRGKGEYLTAADRDFPTGDMFGHEGGGRDEDAADFSFMWN